MSILHRHLQRLRALALFASLWMALAPSVTRLSQAAAQDRWLDDAMHVMCTQAGLAWATPASIGATAFGAAGLDAAGRDAGGGPGDGDGHAPDRHAGDCELCPLAAPLLLPDPPTLVSWIAAPPRHVAARDAQSTRPARHLLGWAPRGPPRSSRAH